MRRRVTDKPWVTEEFRRLIRCRQFAWTHSNFVQYKCFHNIVNRLSKQLRQQYYRKHIQHLKSSNPARWWCLTKKLTGQSHKSDMANLIDTAAGGNVQLLAELVNDFLQSVSSDLDQLPTSATFAVNECTSEKFVVTPYAVFRQLSCISVRKSSGPDDIPNWVLRDFAFALSEPICTIFNYSIQHGIVPALWKMANVVPIPKAHPPRSIENDLRPISLTSTLSKVLEAFVGRWMLNSLVNKFDCRQFGALRGRSTTHALIDILHTLHQALDNNQSARVLFVDYCKALDRVDHATVLRKMAILGIDPFLLRWMHSFLLNRQQRVKIGSNVSRWAVLRGGIPQGSWFGPLTFLILINDLETSLPLFKFVDDTTMVEVINQYGTSNFQAAANQLATWSQLNFMNVNSRKTKEMCIGSIAKNPPVPVCINGNCIDQVESFKLLGVTLANDLTWEAHTSAVCSKASKRLHFLKLLKRSSMSSDDLLQFYKLVIRSVIEYACPAWQSSLTSEQRNQLESIQRRAL